MEKCEVILVAATHQAICGGYILWHAMSIDEGVPDRVFSEDFLQMKVQ